MQVSEAVEIYLSSLLDKSPKYQEWAKKLSSAS